METNHLVFTHYNYYLSCFFYRFTLPNFHINALFVVSTFSIWRSSWTQLKMTNFNLLQFKHYTKIGNSSRFWTGTNSLCHGTNPWQIRAWQIILSRSATVTNRRCPGLDRVFWSSKNLILSRLVTVTSSMLVTVLVRDNCSLSYGLQPW